MGGYSCHMHLAGGELDEEKDVQGLQPDCLNGEKVASDDPLRLCSQKLRPARSIPPRSRIQPMSRWTVLVPTLISSLRSSPWILMYPQQQATRRRQKQSVPVPQLRASDLAAQNAELMTKNDDLDIPGVLVAAGEELKEGAQYQVEN